MGKVVDNLFQKIAIPVIVFAGVLILFFTISNNANTSSENNAYVRVINCIISFTPDNRTRAEIEACYVTVENDLNVTLKRYDSSIREQR